MRRAKDEIAVVDGINQMTALAAQDLEFGFPGTGKKVVNHISLTLAAHEMAALIGPNGSGKSTLVRLLSGYLKPDSGVVWLFGQNIGKMPRKAAARLLTVMPQNIQFETPFTVEEIVRMGSFARPEGLDCHTAKILLQRLDLWELRNKAVTELSGGETRRAALAQALAQKPSVLLLDEPAANLDIRYQYELMELIAELHQETGLTALVVLHDLNLAAAYASRIIMLDEGQVAADGKPQEVLTPQNLANHFGVDAAVTVANDGVPRIRVIPPKHRSKEKNGQCQTLIDFRDHGG
ncbi:MAG TPA: iron ABC transporter ATP-binding protein [Firmicutes bacterium]|jgi:iron complex transport system ATP-binding protein|nr:iron ABC transporter ATP-binding protein [Bacillota bacterium]HCF91655.1 iron ABC transporter ATP-binding protein [Bacillota bacterium]HCT36633.1 iron ABC transporter ATP-binding protein [Bacillota bacterium]